MSPRSYELLLPENGESRESYCRRLTSDGHEEMFVRKALASHFSMSIEEMGDFFDAFPEARLRHLRMLEEMAPNRTDYSFTLKISKNLGISRERAEYWLALYHASN